MAGLDNFARGTTPSVHHPVPLATSLHPGSSIEPCLTSSSTIFCAYCGSCWGGRKPFISLQLRPVACQGDASRVLDFRVKSLVQRQILSSLVLESIHQYKIIWHCFLCLVGTQSFEEAFVPHLHGNNRSYFWYGFYGSTLWKL